MTATPEELLEGLPETLDALLTHPERHKPEVVERLLELADERRHEDPEPALTLVEAAQRLAAKTPAFFSREARLRLRARSFEVWGSLQRSLGNEVGAEGGYMAAFEMLDQLESASPEKMAKILGRRAVLAGDRREYEGVVPFVEAGLQIAKELDADSPLETIKPLMEAVMEEENSILPALWVTLAVVSNTTSIPVGGGGETIGHTTTDLEFGEQGLEVVLRRHADPGGGLPWKISARIRLISHDHWEIYWWRDVPSAESSSGWEVDEMIGWHLWATVEAMERWEEEEGGDSSAC